MVSRLLTYDIMRKLTHGVITKMTQSGRIADTWSGATSNPPPYFKPSHPLVLDHFVKSSSHIPCHPHFHSPPPPPSLLH